MWAAGFLGISVNVGEAAMHLDCGRLGRGIQRQPKINGTAVQVSYARHGHQLATMQVKVEANIICNTLSAMNSVKFPSDVCV